MFIFGTYIDIV